MIKKLKSMDLNTRVVMLVIIAVTLPSILFTVIFFSYIKSNMINSQLDAMEHLMRQQELQMTKNIEGIQMMEKFFVGDEALIDFLIKAKYNKVTTRESIRFYKETVQTLERMVNNNPNLYQVRIYIPHDNVQEMMPILYRKERMEKLEWGKSTDVLGWHFNYLDELFYTDGTKEQLMAHVSLLREPYTDRVLGTMEVAVSMETMFPSLYQQEADRWNYFILKNGVHYPSECISLEEKLKDLQEKDALYTYYDQIQGRDVVIGYLPIEDLDGALIAIRDITNDLIQVKHTVIMVICLILLILIVFSRAINYVIKKMFKQFYNILYSIRKIQKGDLNVVIETKGQDEVSELGAQINKMSEQIKHLMEENVHREVLIKNSEIKALQNQINAHFIYNVLESIKMMAEIDEKYEISDATTALGKLLRYTMKWTSSHVTVYEEIEYIKNYLKLINLRFDYEIKLSLDLSDFVYQQKLPKMSLQPIIENAIYHGIEEIAEDTILYIRAEVEEGDVIIEVTDTGKGMDEKTLEQLYMKIEGEIETSGGSGNGIGLKNVQDRIKMSFGEKYGLSIISKEDYYTKVKMTIPVTVLDKGRR